MMPRMWIRLNPSGRIYCCKSIISTCYRGKLYTAPGPSGDPPVSAATEEINAILFELNQKYASPDRQLAFLAVPNGDGDDILRLDWIYQNEAVTTNLEGNY
jgi:hypothetical protein